MATPSNSTMVLLGTLANAINNRVPGTTLTSVVVNCTDAKDLAGASAPAYFIRKINEKGAPWYKEANGAPVIGKGAAGASVVAGTATVIYPE